jgi:hypothetical protein
MVSSPDNRAAGVAQMGWIPSREVHGEFNGLKAPIGDVGVFNSERSSVEPASETFPVTLSKFAASVAPRSISTASLDIKAAVWRNEGRYDASLT